MSILKRFKSYSVRVPKVVKEALGEATPTKEFVAVDLSGSKTLLEIGEALSSASQTISEKLGQLIPAVREAAEAKGISTDFLDQIPSLEGVAKKLISNLDVESALLTAFRQQAFEEYCAANPAVQEALNAAAALSPVKTGSGRGLKVDIDL